MPGHPIGDVPPFPVADFLTIWRLNGYWSPDRRVRPVMGRAMAEGDGIRSDTLRRADLWPAYAAVARAFDPARPRRERLGPGHWLCWLAMQCGMQRQVDGEYVIAYPKSLSVMTDEECAVAYGYTPASAYEMHRKAQADVTRAWREVNLFGAESPELLRDPMGA